MAPVVPALTDSPPQMMEAMAICQATSPLAATRWVGAPTRSVTMAKRRRSISSGSAAGGGQGKGFGCTQSESTDW